jgi:hypothetical protein
VKRRSIAAGMAALVLSVGAACSGAPMASTSGSPDSCALDGLTVRLGDGGLAPTHDFAVLELRDSGRRPCEMRSAVTLTALDRARHPLPGVHVLHSGPAQTPIVLGSLSSGAATLKRNGELDGLGILLGGGNENDRGGCTGKKLIDPAFWQITLNRASQVIRNDLGKRNVARRLATCRARGSGFSASRQMPNADLPVRPRPS